MIQIKNRFTGSVKVSFDLKTLAGADLSGADLIEANLAGAHLTGADLTMANLSGTILTGVDLTRANLTAIRADLMEVLFTMTRDEVSGLLSAVKSGRIDGSCYEGTCACLVGTLAKLKGVEFQTLYPDRSRPIERFFLAIREGDTPETSQVSAIVAEWIEDYLKDRKKTKNDSN